MRLDEVVGRLKRVRRSGDGYVALCSAHDDRHPSLSIRQREDRVLLHCFRDCSIEATAKLWKSESTICLAHRIHSQIADGPLSSVANMLEPIGEILASLFENSSIERARSDSARCADSSQIGGATH